MGCVNISSKEFKQLAQNNNLSSSTLELITHKYWLQTGNETLFPTDIYIQNQLGNTHYQETSKAVRKLWDMEYKHPMEFSTLRALEEAKEKAAKFFPQSAITSYKNAKNSFVLSVKRPVEKTDYTKDSFFEELDKLGSMKDIKVLDLDIREDQSYGIDKVKSLYDRFNTDRTTKDLANRVFTIANDLGLNITFGQNLPFGIVGRYTNNNTITFKKSFLERDIMNNAKAPIILHEVIHALSMYALSDQTANWKRPEALQKFRTEMNSLYQDLKNNPILKGERGVVDLSEFVAELGNPVFRAKLKEIDKQNKEKKSFWSRILDAFKSLIGLHTSNSYYQRSMNALDKALDAFDVDTYMRYNGIKNSLRQGYNAREWEINTMTDKELEEKVGNYFEKEVTDNTINTENQRIENKNNTQYEEAVKSAGRIFESTFNILGNEHSRVGRSSKEKASTGKSLREQLHEESSRQQKELVSWATKNNQLVVEPNNYYEEKLGDSLSGSEARVWRKGNTVTKNISLNHYSTPKALMDRILIHNMAFPATAMTMQKVGTSDKGISIVVEQPLIVDSGAIPTIQEIEGYMVAQGFTHTKGKGINAEWSKDNYIVSDIRPENVIKQPDGTLAVLDCFAMFKSEATTLSPRTPKDFINSLTGKQLKDELSIIKQENADYDLIHDVEPEKKSTLTQQVIDHLKSIPGINVLGRSAMGEFLKTHNIAGLQQAIAFSKENPYVNSQYKAKVPEILSIIKANKYNNSGTDAVTLNSDAHKTLYLIDHSADNELADNLKDGDGFGIRKAYDINKLTENDIKEITRNIAGDYRNSEKSIRNRLQRLGITPENLPSIDIDAAIKRGIRDYGKMDAQARGFGKQALKNRSSIDGRENQGMLPLYTTEQGEVYGFVDKEGNIYLDETKISPNHPIHEYTHLWDRAVQKNNHKLWLKGIELMKKTSLWNDILNDKNYGKQWQSMNLPKEKLENLIASEVHARLVGENGEKLLNNLAKQKDQEGIIGKLKQWVLDMWKEVKATFGNWSQEGLDNLTLEDFNRMTIRDFVEGVDTTQNTKENTTQETTEVEQVHERDVASEPSQEEISNSLSPKKQQIQQNLTEFEKLTQQINNLLDSNVITASEVRHVAELVVNTISDTISDIQKGNINPETEFTGLSTDMDFSTATRKQIVETIGINRLIERAKESFDPQNNMAIEDMNTLEQADLIIDNWEAIMTLAADVFAANEGFGIRRNYDEGGFQTVENSAVEYDNFNQSEDTETTEETEGDEQEYWQVEARTIDVLTSMSQLVRQALHECYLIDAEGNKVMSKWGIAERVNPRKAVNSILRWTQGSLSLDDMVSRLNNKAVQNPWVSQLVLRLSDKSGRESDFQSQFYGVFSKHFQLYSIVLREDGKYAAIPVNSHPALSEAIQTITTQYKIGEHPLFSEKGINAKLLGSENTTSPDTDFNLHKALRELQTIVDRLKHGEQLDVKMSEEASANLMATCRVLGYSVSEEMLSGIMNEENIQKMTSSLGFLVRSLDSALKAQKRNGKEYDPFAYGADNNIGGTLRNFLTPITDTLEDTAINAFYDSGKMYQSYVTPSFMTKLLSKFRQEGQAFEDFILDEYGSSEWFKFNAGDGDINKGWRNEWLRLLARDENARKVFDHKVELNFNKHNYMRTMSDAEYALSLITEYFAESSQMGQDMVPAWFRIPMLSNKPSSEFIKFYSYRGSNYKDTIVHHLYNMFLQELSRIQTVRMRNHSKDDAAYIKNFDSNGRKFNFLPFLNEYLEKSDNRLATLLNKKIEGTEKLSADEEAALGTLVKQAIHQHMENRVQAILDKWQNNGILEATKSIKDILPAELKGGAADQWVRQQVENFLWNDNFASKNILQLTITDIAFYKDAEDMQKRLAQLHAPGIRGNVLATDYEGNRVSDGKYRTIVIRDYNNFVSNIIDNIAEVFDRKIVAAPEGQKAALETLKEGLVGENGCYRSINVADAQGYSSPSSYRKKAFIFGKWSHKAEEIYNKLRKGDYNYSDLETAFQPLKPFVYSRLQKNMGVDNAPIKTMHVPFQAKNAEYLLIMADAILQGEETSKPNLLRAVYRVMEESERLNPTKGIDTVQFESAIKSSLQGKLNIHQFMEMPGGEEAAYTFIMQQIYTDWSPSAQYDTSSQRPQYNTNTFVYETSFEDYCMQQEVPAHFRGHAQSHGSQIRMITPSDLDYYRNPNGDITAEDNIVYYEWTEPDGTHKKLRADEFRREYENTIAANIAQSIEDLGNALHINSEDKKERNIALSKILQREILSSPRYGVDLIQACSIDKETGEFRIPKGDPIQAKRIEQLINSIIKNRINKQKIAGGPIVQVSNFGTSRQLHIRFNSKRGGLLMTKEEYEQNPQKKEMSQTDKFQARYKGTGSNTMSYAEYCKENQAGIAYFEVFAPIWDNEIFEKFGNPDGTISMEAIEATDPELLKMISYRIPTEDKYSCAPIKVVGFMPREAGDAIMLPYELTEIDGSDFDVDKRYVMRKDIPIKTRSKKEIKEKLFDSLNESYKKAHDGKENKHWVNEQIKMFLDNPQKMKNADVLMQSLYKEYQKVAYFTEPATDGRTYRDNKIIDMTWAVLTNEMTADKILNPGGFEDFKRSGYMIAAYKNGKATWDKLQGMSVSQLKEASFVEKDITWADTQVHFYHQNAAGSNLIGVFAVNKVAHATLEGNDLFIAVDEICGEPFTIADMVFEGKMAVDPMLDRKGNMIGKTLGSGTAASADTAKEPILDLMNINMTTADVFNTMLRLGMPLEDASLMSSQDVITKILEDFNRENLTNHQPLSNIIEVKLQKMRQQHNITETSNINTEPLTREELIEGLEDSNMLSKSLKEGRQVIDYKALLAFQKLRSLAEAMRKPTFATRLNSVSSAVGPLIVDNLILEHKMEQFMDSNTENGTHFYTADGTTVDIDDVFYDHPILRQFAKAVDVAKKMFYDMPTGSTGFRNVLNSLPNGLANTLYSDRKLLDQLSNFYQSYLLIASGYIQEGQLKNYVDGFAKWFMQQNFKEKYPENELIQAIRTGVNKQTNRPYLSINITGEDIQVKERLGNAWIDLHKADPELSQRLFAYNFFRAGVGFSPKTFMTLVPTFVKERLERSLDDGTKVSYVNTYRNFPTVNPNVVIDQFIRNNWNNNKLVPKKGDKGNHYQVDLQQGTLTVRDKSDMADLRGVPYMKTYHNGQTYLWKLIGADEYAMNYIMVKPLGSNGEYLEMSLSDIQKPISDTKHLVEERDIDTSAELQEQAPVEADAEGVVITPVKDTQVAKDLAWFADGIMKQRDAIGKPVNKTEARNMVEKMKESPERYGDYFIRVFKQLGMEITKDNAVKEFKKLC